MTSQALSRRLARTNDLERRKFELMAAEFLVRMGERFRDRREELGLSRAEVARRMPGKVNENQVYRWELGKHQPNPDTLEALAGVLGRDVAYFMAPAPDKTETPTPFDSSSPDIAARLAAQDDRLAKIEHQLGQLLGLLGADPSRHADIGDVLKRVLEQWLQQQGREVGRPRPKRDRAKGRPDAGQPHAA